MGAIASARDIMILMPAILMGLTQQVSASSCGHGGGNQQDSAYLKQQLHNGRVWEKKYDKVTGHEFFLTEALSEASVTVGDRTFNDQLIWYDIYNDRIVLMVRPGYFIELSGENAERFTFRYLNENYFFRYFGEKGYCQLFHEGRVLLVRRYVKVIKKNAVNGSFDIFEEEATDYLVKEGSFTRLRTRKDIFSVVADREEEVRRFIRENGIRVSPKRPGSIIPVLQFYDSL